MWLGLFLIIIAVACAIASVASAGTFTLVLVPIAVIALIAAVFSFVGHRAAGTREATRADAGGPDTVGRPEGGFERRPGRAAVTPGRFVRMRQAAQ